MIQHNFAMKTPSSSTSSTCVTRDLQWMMRSYSSVSWNVNSQVMEEHHESNVSIGSTTTTIDPVPEDELDISLYVITWNVNCKVLAEELVSIVRENMDQGIDFFVIGLQEAPRTSRFGELLQRALGKGYCLVGVCVLVSLQLLIFSKTSHIGYIEGIRKDTMGEGLGGIVGKQKGAVAISFKFMDTSFLFISCHLRPHEANVESRNNQYRKITKKIFSKNKSPTSYLALPLTSIIGKRRGTREYVKPSLIDISDVVLWLGDLNYRVVGTRRTVDLLLFQNKQTSLRENDQLCREAERGEIFEGFCEGMISFRPTYKYDLGSDVYDSSAKERVPSWTDRILYKISPSSAISAYLEVYDSIESIRVSDHKPVKALLHLKTGSSSAHPQHLLCTTRKTAWIQYGRSKTIS